MRVVRWRTLIGLEGRLPTATGRQRCISPRGWSKLIVLSRRREDALFFPLIGLWMVGSHNWTVCVILQNMGIVII